MRKWYTFQLLHTDLIISPSDNEAAAMGATDAERIINGKDYVFDVLDAMAMNYGKKGIDNRHNLAAFAIPHLYKKGKKQLHWHVLVARKDISNKMKLSPLTNHRNTSKGPVTGGFDRENFDFICEKMFDARFAYDRPVEESFKYCLSLKKGTSDERNEQLQKLAKQQFDELIPNQDNFMENLKLIFDMHNALSQAEFKEQAEHDEFETAHIENGNDITSTIIEIVSNCHDVDDLCERLAAANLTLMPVLDDELNITDFTIGFDGIDFSAHEILTEKEYDMLEQNFENNLEQDEPYNDELLSDLKAMLAALEQPGPEIFKNTHGNPTGKTSNELDWERQQKEGEIRRQIAEARRRRR